MNPAVTRRQEGERHAPGAGKAGAPPEPGPAAPPKPPAPAHQPKKCGSCPALIFWAQTENGKSMPVDAEPTPDGNVILFATPAGGIRAHVLKKDEQPPPGAKRRQAHWASCPNANQHRRKP